MMWLILEEYKENDFCRRWFAPVYIGENRVIELSEGWCRCQGMGRCRCVIIWVSLIVQLYNFDTTEKYKPIYLVNAMVRMGFLTSYNKQSYLFPES